jgi:hypothetical protein
MERFYEMARADSLERFLEQCSDPVLVVTPFGAPDQILVETLVPGATLAEGALKVAWVRKRAGANAFAGMITVGRTANNDIHLDGVGVSKFHAYLKVGAAGDVVLVDADSTHGTFVRDRKLVAREEMLEPGTPIRFGGVHATFYTPRAFHDMLLETGRISRGKAGPGGPKPKA